MANLKQNNDMAVSPIVATLVLIVVAVIGAVAVGTIMGTFSTDVSKQANTGAVSDQASTEILVAGSTTVQPASEAWSKAYTKQNPSTKIAVQAGGSGAGISSVGMKIVDIGASSRPLKDAEKASYPDLKEYQVGGSAVVFIVNSGTTTASVTKNELYAAYNGGGITGALSTMGINQARVYQRAESSGTEETVAEDYFGISTKNLDAFTTIVGQTGNAGMLKAVQDNANSLGFVDYGYAADATGIKILTITGTGAPDKTNIKEALKNKFGGKTQTATAYEQKLARGLYYFTNGEPNSVVKNYITFCQSPAGGALITTTDIGMFSLGDIYG